MYQRFSIFYHNWQYNKGLISSLIYNDININIMMLLQVTILHAFKVNGRFYFHLECLFSWKSFLLTNNLWSLCAKRSYIHMYVYSSFELITIFVSTETQMLLMCYCCCLRHVYSAVVEFNVQISERKTQFFLSFLVVWFEHILL